MWFSENYLITVMEYAMFNKELAGIVGQHNGDWNFRHEYWRALWMETHMNASPGQSLDPVLWEAKKELRAIHPRYARGVVMLGGWLLVPGNESAIASTTGKPVFRVTQQAMRNSTRLVFTLPEDAQVTLYIRHHGPRSPGDFALRKDGTRTCEGEYRPDQYDSHDPVPPLRLE